MRTSSWGVPTVLVLVLTMMASGRAEADFVVLPPHAVVGGTTLQEWSANWQIWASTFPVDTNPNFDPTGARGALGDVGPVFFLGTVFILVPGPVPSELTATRAITVPPDKFIFFPVIQGANANDPALPPLTVDQLRSDLAGLVAAPLELHATIDGVSVPDLSSHREISPVFGLPTVLAQSLGAENLPGILFPTVSDGYWLMLEPLSPGPHVINFGATLLVNGMPFRTDVTYNITAVPEPASLTLMGLGVLGLIGFARLRRKP